MLRILAVLGTRPEAIKLAPLILRAQADPRFKMLVCSTGQHREMLKPILQFFSITPDLDLDLMRPDQSLLDISVGVLTGLTNYLKTERIDGIVVQGDTTTCFCASLAGFYSRIPVYHVEAGLRSSDLRSPFPEEFNRRATALTADFHFAPTAGARNHLLNEGVKDDKIEVTGNTGIDALFDVRSRIRSDSALSEKLTKTYDYLDPRRKLILVTVHRRESFGKILEDIMKSVVEIASEPDVEVYFPMHLNPRVRETAARIFGDRATWVGDQKNQSDAARPRIWLSEPIDYVPFVYLMDRSHLIITDSGGVQEEAPSLGKPVLVARMNTERPEGIAAGNSMLLPLDPHGFVTEVRKVLQDKALYQSMSKAANPYGDGQACARILDQIASVGQP